MAFYSKSLSLVEQNYEIHDKEMLDFCRRKCLCKYVSYHIFSGAINQLYFPFFNDLLNKMVSDVNMFGLGMILVVFC